MPFRPLALVLLLAACHGSPDHHGHGHAHAGARASGSASTPTALEAVAMVHGGAGPWAVAGYRMGTAALARLGLPRGSFDLEVVHHTPAEVQYSCIADGAAAATGASLGKLNLSLEAATAAETHTVYRRRSTGQAVDLRVTEGFRRRFGDVPREKLAEMGGVVAALAEGEIFEVVP